MSNIRNRAKFGYYNAVNNKLFIDYDETDISKDAFYSYLYTKDILKRRFELGEKSISSSEYRHQYILIL